ncbi:MAG: hypothetical protein KatS3mg007_0480 [Thermoanaerobaculum sp.]|nr:MAG: hypothetical protein KatS3mg007_0480 [Thermoanaerobaculum sp.]GBC79465.1 hypothetical protein HRbin09_00684 [bacterium HR09]
MAEITPRRQGELVRGVFKILMEHQDGLPAREVLKKLETIVPPTPFELSEYPNRPGVRRYEKIVRFSTIPAVKAGWLIKERGKWLLSDQGREACRRYQDPEEFARQAIRLYREWRRSEAQDTESEETARSTLEEAEETAWREIQEYLMNLAPMDFQNLVAALLRGMGYHVSWVAPPGPDGGTDIIAFSDPLGIKRPRIRVQVKRKQDKVSAEGLRSFMAILGDDDVGLFISAGGFTREAEMEARAQQKRHVTLLDLERLFVLWVEHYAQIPEEGRRLLPLKAVYYLAPRD